MRTLKQWENLVTETTRVKLPVDALEIAKRCLDAEGRGEPASVWHEAAAYYGTECHCRPCESARGGTLGKAR